MNVLPKILDFSRTVDSNLKILPEFKFWLSAKKNLRDIVVDKEMTTSNDCSLEDKISLKEPVCKQFVFPALNVVNYHGRHNYVNMSWSYLITLDLCTLSLASLGDVKTEMFYDTVFYLGTCSFVT